VTDGDLHSSLLRYEVNYNRIFYSTSRWNLRKSANNTCSKNGQVSKKMNLLHNKKKLPIESDNEIKIQKLFFQ
jgi:hypothetical protein